MRISESSWKRYVGALRKVSDKATESMLHYIGEFGIPRQGEDWNDFIFAAYNISTKYGEAAATLAAEMYDVVADLSGVSVAPAVPAEPASYHTVAETVQGVAKQSGNAETVAGAVGRLVKQAGADTTLQNALRDGAEFAWVPSGDTCAFCITLASNGWRKASKKAVKNGHAEHIHTNCDCTYAIRFDSSTEVPGYDPAHYLTLYETAGGVSPKDRINALRRELYAENKDKINAQKRAAYAARKARAWVPAINASFDDVTVAWRAGATPDSHKVEDLQEYVAPDGSAYKVHGKSVVLDYKPHEKEIAELLEREFGGELYMVPRVNNPQGVRTPDYLFRGRPYDLKTLGPNAGQNTIFNRIKNSSGQSGNFVIDVSKSGLSDDAISRQIKKVFWSQNTQFVDTVIIVRHDSVISILQRKK